MTFPFYNIGIKVIVFPLVNPNLADPRFMQRLLTREKDEGMQLLSAYS